MGVFGRGRTPTAILRNGVHATKIYVGDRLVWDGTRPALVNMVRAHGVGSAPTFGVVADSSVGVPVASATGVGLPPVLGADALVTVPVSTGVAGIVAPVVTADSAVAVPASTAAAEAPAPTGAEQFNVTVAVPPAEGSAEAPVFVVAAHVDTVVPVAEGTAEALVPAVSATGSALVGMVVAVGSTVAVAPGVSASSPVAVPAATGAASAPAAALSLGGSVTVPVATGSGLAKPFVVSTAPVPSGMDKFNAQALTVRSVWTQVTSWTTRAGFATNSGIASHSLVSNGSGPVNITCQITQGNEGTSSNVKGCRVLVNGVVVQTFTGTGGATANRIHGGTFTQSLASGDVVTMEAYHDSTTASYREVQASGTYLFWS